LATRLRRLRDAAGLSQQKLAERSGLSISLIVQMEAGKRTDPRVSTVRALARALDVPVTDLIEGIEDPPPEAPKRKGRK
jgi:transcriptional regulator with XRE-family HTH domain